MQLVYFDNDIGLYTTSDIVARVTNLQQHSITRVIRNHKGKFLKVGSVNTRNLKSGRGRPKKQYLLSEAQTYLLISLQRNLYRNDEVVGEYKTLFAKAYDKARKGVNT